MAPPRSQPLAVSLVLWYLGIAPRESAKQRENTQHMHPTRRNALHGSREDGGIQVVPHRLAAVLEQLVELPHLLVVRHMHMHEAQQRPRRDSLSARKRNLGWDTSTRGVDTPW